MKIKNDLYIELSEYISSKQENCREDKINQLLSKAQSKEYIPDEELAKSLMVKSSLYNYPSIITFLTENGFNPNFVERGNFTPLHLAAGNNNHDSALALISGGANPTALDHMNRTPAELAKSNGFEDMANIIEKSLSPQTSLPTLRPITRKKRLSTIVEEELSLEEISHNDSSFLPPINSKSKKDLAEVKQSLSNLKEKSKSSTDLLTKLPPIVKVRSTHSI